ncbi:hypothetical protein F5Y18DRAFT_33607 [Xylariaceae sp. FL1019]|nr:hypothetical protein F5Y18DRAFT_33607 [Xylariaceae sp. FL1019]
MAIIVANGDCVIMSLVTLASVAASCDLLVISTRRKPDSQQTNQVTSVSPVHISIRHIECRARCIGTSFLPWCTGIRSLIVLEIGLHYSSIMFHGSAGL